MYIPTLGVVIKNETEYSIEVCEVYSIHEFLLYIFYFCYFSFSDKTVYQKGLEIDSISY